MKLNVVVVLAAVIALCAGPALGQKYTPRETLEPVKVIGQLQDYQLNNKFFDYPTSFFRIWDPETFREVFMPRWPFYDPVDEIKPGFKNHMVIAVAKCGNRRCELELEGVEADGYTLYVRYSYRVTERVRNGYASSPLILVLNRLPYQRVVFIQNGKEVKVLR